MGNFQSVDDLQTSVLEGTSAKQTLVTANLRLVHSLVNQCTRRHGEKLSFCKTQDLLQEGVFGLLRAAEKFDCDKGFRFSTYATYWVNVSQEKPFHNYCTVGRGLTEKNIFFLR